MSQLTKTGTLFLGILIAVAATAEAANPFPAIDPRHTFDYDTDFTDSVPVLQSQGWDFSAGQFISHAHAPTFRPPEASTVSGGLLSSNGQDNASARLNLTTAVGSMLNVGSGASEQVALYIRLDVDNTDSNAAFLFGVQNDVAADGVSTFGTPNPPTNTARTLSGYVRRGSDLLSWGAKTDHNNPADSPLPGGQVGDGGFDFDGGPGTFEDFLVLIDPSSTVTLYRKSVSANNWMQVGGSLTAVGFATDYAFLYMPSNGDFNISDFAISTGTPEPASLTLVGLGALALMRRRRRA